MAARRLVADPGAVRAAIAHIRRKPREFIRRLRIVGVDEKGRAKRMRLATLWPEQVPWLEALLTCRYILGIKPRQVGFSTITIAYFVWKVLTSTEPRLVLQMVHEIGAMTRFMRMLRVFILGLPAELRPRLKPNNLVETVIANYDDDRGWNRLLAGGAGQGRSWTYTDIHATEMSKWRVGTAATANDEGQPADEEAWTSALATIHDAEWGQVVVESTGNGARGLFYGLYSTAKVDPNWRLVFTPWSAVRRYRIALTPGEAEVLHRDLDRKELKLAEDFGLDLEQLAWRRHRIRVLKGSELMFRREYPLTDLEPFLLAESGWFDQEALVVMLTFCPQLSASQERFVVWERYQEGRGYVLSLDTSGGTGRDEASLHVLRDDGTQVATWNHDRALPDEQALMVARVSNLYRRPITIIERNKFGAQVIERLPPTVNLWKDAKGETFWTDPSSKRQIFVHAREVMNAQRTIPRDAETIRQAQKIVEKPNGRIEGRGESHDDRIMSYVLALWALRKLWRSDSDVKLNQQKESFRRIMRIGGASEVG